MQGRYVDTITGRIAADGPQATNKRGSLKPREGFDSQALVDEYFASQATTNSLRCEFVEMATSWGPLSRALVKESDHFRTNFYGRSGPTPCESDVEVRAPQKTLGGNTSDGFDAYEVGANYDINRVHPNRGSSNLECYWPVELERFIATNQRFLTELVDLYNRDTEKLENMRDRAIDYVNYSEELRGTGGKESKPVSKVEVGLDNTALNLERLQAAEKALHHLYTEHEARGAGVGYGYYGLGLALIIFGKLHYRI
jgi:hypothetical protein